LEDRGHGGVSVGVGGTDGGWVAYGAVLELRLCMNALEPQFAIPTSGTVEVPPFSPLIPSPPAVWRSKGEGGRGGEVT
jgi:hypothetical protein